MNAGREPHGACAAVDAAIAGAFTHACLLELQALKPGNVHRFADGHGMSLADFTASAAACAPAIATRGARVGARILAAVQASWAAVGCNTNLGIVLLCAPLAAGADSLALPARREAAALAAAGARQLRALDVDDAILAYRAIALARPGGLGRTPAHDVRDRPDIDLRTAMMQAQGRDRIAMQYATDFDGIFRTALPCLRRHAAGNPLAVAASALYLELLAQWQDSHVLRKFGDTVAQNVSTEARTLLDRYPQGDATPGAHAALMDWDRRLKSQGINPGTTADLTVATLFVHCLTTA